MDYLPLFFKIAGKACLIVGGGAVAYRKASLLVKAGAVVHVVAPEVIDDVKALVENSGGTVALKNYEPSDLQGKTLVVAATNNRTLNQQVSKEAQALQKPVNVVDDPKLCSFVLGSIVDRSPLVIAISSSGASPVLARMLRARIEAMIPNAYGRLAHFMGGFRSAVKAKIPKDVPRRRFWEKVLEGPVAEKVLAGKEAEAREVFAQELAKDHINSGEICLVGAGPGDPDLLTFKALRLLQAADVVLYDRLVSAPILELSRRDAEKVYVGKARANHAVPQTEINQLLIDYARQGKKVVRLKGGDPFIFGRGGEEIENLRALGIPFQVVPGITAASGCASYSGIPLTHRDYAQSVRFVTGHLKDNSCNLSWHELTDPDQTVVFYMGLAGLSTICQKLIEHGRSPQTPAALIQKGTTPEQKVLLGDLITLPALVAKEQIQAPTLIIVGEVVSLANKLSWFEGKEVSDEQL